MKRKTGQVNARAAIMLARYNRERERYRERMEAGATPVDLAEDKQAAELMLMRARMNKETIARRQAEYRSPVAPLEPRDLDTATVIRVCDETTPERVAVCRRDLLVAREGAAHALFSAGYLGLGNEGRDAVNRVTAVRNARAALARAERKAGVEANDLVSA